MPNTTTQAIVLKDFTGGLWLNEGDPPNNTYSTFLENLDILPGGGVQKRAPIVRACSVAATRQVIYSTTGCGPMNQWLQVNPADGTQYVVVDSPTTGGVSTYRKYGTANATPVVTSSTGSTAIPRSFVHASSDAGAFWYLFFGSPQQTVRFTTAGAASIMGVTFNDNLASPNDLMMPKSDLGVQHLSAYFFLGATNEGGADKPNRIRWSHPGRFEDYRTNDKLDVGDIARIIGLYSVNETLLIVKETSLWVLTGYDTDTFQLRKIADLSYKSGDTANTPIAGCSHAQHGAFIYVAGSGILHWDGKTLKDISMGMRDAIVDGRMLVRNMSIIGTTLYCSGGAAYLAAADLTTDKSWEYDTVHQIWTQHNASFRGLAPIQASIAGTPKAYSVHQYDDNGGYSFSYYRQQAGADSWADTWDGTIRDIVCQWRSPWQDARNPARKKRWRKPWFVFNKRPNASTSDPATYTMTIYKDWDGVHPTKTSTFSASKATDTTDYNTFFGYGHATTGSDYDQGAAFAAPGSGYAMQVLLSSTGTPKDQWGFDSCTFKFVPRSLK